MKYSWRWPQFRLLHHKAACSQRNTAIKGWMSELVSARILVKLFSDNVLECAVNPTRKLLPDLYIKALVAGLKYDVECLKVLTSCQKSEFISQIFQKGHSPRKLNGFMFLFVFFLSCNMNSLFFCD